MSHIEPARLTIGVDIGGTNFRAALYRNLEEATGAPTPIRQRRELIGEDRAPEALVDRLVAAIAELSANETATIPVGVGFAGMLRGHEGFVTRSPHLGWRDVDLGALLRERLPAGSPISIYNDVNAVTFGEHALGAGVGARDVLAVFVGTGIGGGIVAGGRLVDGADNCAAEIGHTKVVIGESARPCQCGLRGCVEAYAGGADLQRRAREELAGGAVSMATRLAGGPERVNPGHLDAAAADGDEYALALYEEVAPLFGLALANAVTLLNPSHLILGGGVLSRTPIFRELSLAAMQVAVNPPAAATLSVVPAKLGDDAGLVGSALLAARGYKPGE